MPIDATSGRQLVKPPALRPGDTIGIVAPASNVKQADLEAGCKALHRLDIRPSTSILFSSAIFTSPERPSGGSHELEEMFERGRKFAPSFARAAATARTICCGISTGRRLQSHPKIFIGYSDVTCLLTQFVDSGLVDVPRADGGERLGARTTV